MAIKAMIQWLLFLVLSTLYEHSVSAQQYVRVGSCCARVVRLVSTVVTRTPTRIIPQPRRDLTVAVLVTFHRQRSPTLKVTK